MGKPVSEKEWLYRRSFASPERRYMNPDGTAHSRAFTLREKDAGDLSVDVASMTTPIISICNPAKYMLFEILNLEVLGLNLSTIHQPVSVSENERANPAHAVIKGMDIENEIIPGQLARKSRRVYI